MRKIDFNKIVKIHFIGIGGIGLSAIAKLMLAQGKEVSGSDANDSEILDELRKMGGKISIGQKGNNLADDAELVIYTLAIPKNNPELQAAEKLNIPILTYPQALGKLFNPESSGFGIAVCGTHGKSTTASMIGSVLAEAGLDPSVVVGSKVPNFGGNLRIGKGKHFVIEACEYERAFLEYWPKIIILNNIELDHTDYYEDIEDYRSAFLEFVGHLPEGGVLIFNGDDKEISNLKFKISKQIQSSNVKVISFGFSENNDLRCRKMEIGEGRTRFWATFDGKELGEFTLRIPGKFNVYNALAATAAGLHLGIDAEKIKETLANFGGIWRRFEIKGIYKGAIIVSDYAHHPTAVKATIEAARQFYPGRRIFAVFQPHQHNRTKMLYQDFLKSFDLADAVILSEIFDVAGREEKRDQNVSSKKMVEDIKSVIASLSSVRRSNPDFIAPPAGLLRLRQRAEPRNDNRSVYLLPENIFYAQNLEETRKLIDKKVKPGDILLIMGAGDIYKIADQLVKR